MSRALFVLLAVVLAAGVASAAPKPRPKKPVAAAKAKRPAPRAKRAAKPRAGYSKHVKGWHDNEPGAGAPVDPSGRPKLVLESINLRERAELQADGPQGGFSNAELARARRVLRDSRGDREHTIDPALLDLLYKLQIHFEAPCVRVISAYRAGRGSRHALGQAADIVVPGAEDRAVAAYARTLGTTGVGLYPASGFVHVDVRESSHYWVDSSGPGASPRKKPRRARAPAPKAKAKQAK